MKKLAHTLVLLICLPCIILAGMAAVVLVSCRATWSLIVRTWSKA